MSIINIVIRALPQNVTAEYIATVFSKQNIAQVKSVTMRSCFDQDMYNEAYVELWSWGESESAYNFLGRLKGLQGEARVVHRDDDAWVIHPYYQAIPSRMDGTKTAYFPYDLYNDDFMISLAERRLAAAQRELMFERDFGDDYQRIVDAEIEYEHAIRALRNICIEEPSFAELYPNVTLRSHQTIY